MTCWLIQVEIYLSQYKHTLGKAAVRDFDRQRITSRTEVTERTERRHPLAWTGDLFGVRRPRAFALG